MKYSKKEMLIENAKRRLQGQANIMINSNPIHNSLGFKIDIDTLTGIKAKVTTQKFYTINKPSDYVPIVVGENPFSEDILTYKEYSTGSDFESGIVQGSTNASRTEKSNVAVEGIKVPVIDWRKMITYNLIELAKASKSGNWSLVEAKEKSRYRNWKLGIQKVIFLGLEGITGVKGLLTQTTVTSNTSTIPTFIKSMSVSQFGTLVENILSDYFSNSNSTEMPTHFVIPTNDFLGLGAPTTETYWNGTKFYWLLETFKQLTGNPNFKILPLAYAQKAHNLDFLGSGSGLNRYSLYNYDDETVRADIPVDFTTTITDTINGFDYQSAAYGQFTGTNIYRKDEVLYFDHSD